MFIRLQNQNITMDNKVYFTIPKGLPYSNIGVNLALELQEEILPEQVLKTAGVSYSRMRLQTPAQLMEYPIFVESRDIAFGSFNHLVVSTLRMYDISTKAQTWVRVTKKHISDYDYKWSTWESVVKQLVIHRLIDFAQDKNGNHYFKFRYDVLVDCKLNSRRFISSLKNSTKEKSIAQNWSKQEMHSHVKTILWECAREKVFIKKISFG